MHKSHFIYLSSFLILLNTCNVNAASCPFDSTKTCALERDILNDIGTNGLRYYAPTNYDHRISGEIDVYDAALVLPYTDATNAPGQLKFIANEINSGYWQSGEIMTRVNLNQAPFNAPQASNPWTTKELQHGYLEVVVKMPKCDTSTDGKCQANTQPDNYQAGLWPAIWMEPTMDANWPQNGEIDISEAYLQGSDYKTSTATIHFNGNDARCNGGDCVFQGFSLTSSKASVELWKDFHTWGFEWQPDPASTDGGQILTGYFDNVKVWGPVQTDTFPADGPNAMSRGFNDPNGGYYLIVNLALGGGYAGAPAAPMESSSMYVQSVKAYNVNGSTPPPTNQCLPPASIQSSYTADKKNITLSWQQPTNSDAITTYQVNDWANKTIWTGTATSFTDTTLPGTNGTFTYFLYSNCPSGQSKGVEEDVVINNTPPPPVAKCLPPASIQSSYTADKKNITLSWQQPANSDTVSTYQVNDWSNKTIWTGTATSFTDTTLPGTNGKFTYFLYSNCPSGQSTGVEEDVVINDNTPTVCLPPANIQSSFTPDKKSITLTWQQPTNSAPISNYQVNDWTNKSMWTGTSLSFTDNTLPGTNGTFTYFLYSNCTNGLSQMVQQNVTIQ